MGLTELDIFNEALSACGDKSLELGAAVQLDDATAADPVVVTTNVAHGRSSGGAVFLQNLDQQTELNGRAFLVDVLTASTYELRGEDGTGRTAQTTNVTNGVRNFSDKKPSRVCVGRYRTLRDEVLTAYPWSAVTKRGRLMRLDSALTLTAATAASPVLVTSVAHGLVSGDQVYLAPVLGMIEISDRLFTVNIPALLPLDTFELVGEDGSTYGAFTSGTAKKVLSPLKPDSGFAFRYDFPDDALWIYDLDFEKDRDDPKWIVEHTGSEKAVLANIGDTIPCRYCRNDLLSPSDYDPQLVTALIARLAAGINEEITGSNSKNELRWAEYSALIEQAEQADSDQGGPVELAHDSWRLARDA